MKNIKIKKIKKYIAILTSASMILTGISVSAANKNIKFIKNKQTVYVGKKITLKVSVPKKYKNKTSKIKWSSSNTKVAVVNKKGVVTGKKKGTVVIKAKFYGTTAKCTINVKKKSAVKPTIKPEVTVSPEITASPVSTPEPEISSTPSAEPTTPVTEPTVQPVDPSESTMPTSEPAEPSPSASAEPATTESTAPSETSKPSETIAPSPSNKPSQTPDVNTGKLVPVSDTGAVKAYGLAKINGEVTTIYLVNRDYEGNLKIGFEGNVYEQSGNVREALVMLDTLYITKTNSAETIKVSRTKPEKYWTITDLKGKKDYYLRVERRNTYDTSYENCGAIYFKGDVTDVVSIY